MKSKQKQNVFIKKREPESVFFVFFVFFPMGLNERISSKFVAKIKNSISIWEENNPKIEWDFIAFRLTTERAIDVGF